MIEDIKSVKFDTINSNNTSKFEPNFSLKNPISLADSYAVTSFTGINTIYNIDSRNNTITFIDQSFPGTILQAFLQVGNYTISTFITEIGDKMTLVGAQTYTCSNNSISNKLTISSVGPFRLINSTNNFFYESGFQPSVGFANPQVAENTYDLSGLKQINVVCNSLQNGNTIVANNNKNVIFTIPVTSAYLGVISFNPTPIFISSQIDNLSFFEFYLLDERYRQLENVKDWSVNLIFRNVL